MREGPAMTIGGHTLSLDDRDWYREDAKRRTQLPHINRNARKSRSGVLFVSTSKTPRRFRLWHLVIVVALLGVIIRRFA